MKIFKKKEEKTTEVYKIALCDENDLSTKFGEYNSTFETYDSADHAIRMGWNKKREQRVKDGYKINDAWLVIEKIS